MHVGTYYYLCIYTDSAWRWNIFDDLLTRYEYKLFVCSVLYFLIYNISYFQSIIVWLLFKNKPNWCYIYCLYYIFMSNIY
jgi:hypothetical protein